MSLKALQKTQSTSSQLGKRSEAFMTNIPGWLVKTSSMRISKRRHLSSGNSQNVYIAQAQPLAPDGSGTVMTDEPYDCLLIGKRCVSGMRRNVSPSFVFIKNVV